MACSLSLTLLHSKNRSVLELILYHANMSCAPTNMVSPIIIKQSFRRFRNGPTPSLSSNHTFLNICTWPTNIRKEVRVDRPTGLDPRCIVSSKRNTATTMHRTFRTIRKIFIVAYSHWHWHIILAISINLLSVSFQRGIADATCEGATRSWQRVRWQRAARESWH